MSKKHKYWGFIKRYPNPLISFGKNKKEARKGFKRIFGEEPSSLLRIY